MSRRERASAARRTPGQNVPGTLAPALAPVLKAPQSLTLSAPCVGQEAGPLHAIPPPPPPRGGARGSYVSTLARQQAGDVLACACSAPFLLSGFVGLSGAGLCGHPSLSCSVNWERLWPGRGLWTWAQRCSGLPNVPHLEWQVKIKRKGKEARNRSCLRDGKRVSWAER